MTYYRTVFNAVAPMKEWLFRWLCTSCNKDKMKEIIQDYHNPQYLKCVNWTSYLWRSKCGRNGSHGNVWNYLPGAVPSFNKRNKFIVFDNILPCTLPKRFPLNISMEYLMVPLANVVKRLMAVWTDKVFLNK